jgi:hypothetical protein
MSTRNKRTDVWKHINLHGGDTSVCWEWLLAPGGAKGRGKQRAYITVAGRKLVVQRVIHEDMHGVTLSPDELIRHTCDNGLCCNYTHWTIGTHQQNMDDMVSRDRHGLPSHVVRRVRVLLARGGMTHQEIGDMYAISRTVVTRIANDDAHTHANDYPSEAELRNDA